jgi:hypothetical protein
VIIFQQFQENALMDTRTKTGHINSLKLFEHLVLGHTSRARASGLTDEQIWLKAIEAVQVLGLEIIKKNERASGFSEAAARVLKPSRRGRGLRELLDQFPLEHTLLEPPAPTTYRTAN